MSTPTLPGTAHPVAVALNKILDEVSSIYFERRAVVEALLVTILAKQHAFLLGPPGTGKSEMVREIIKRFVTATYFETVLSKTRPDAAILGPYNLPELRDKGDFHRKTNGFLPTANFAFLDEIGKMSPTLGHDMLAILNERLYHEVNGGRSAKPVPLYSALTASNELIVEESDDAAALWDRLLVRIVVDYLQESGNFAQLLTPNTSSASFTTIDFQDLADAIDTVVPAVNVPVNVVEQVLRLRDEMRSAEIIVSDRRWRQCMRLLQASAFFNGRTEVTDDDIHMLRFALWDVPTQINTVERLCLSLSNPLAEKCLGFLDDLNGLDAGIRDAKGLALSDKSGLATEYNGKVKMLTSEIEKLRQETIAAGRSTTKIDEVRDRLQSVKRSIYTDLLEMDPMAMWSQS